MVPKESTTSRGFTLLEVIITIAILVSLIMAVAQLLRSSFDIRLSISADSKVTQTMNIAMQRLAEDIGHAYLINSKDQVRTAGAKRTIFKIAKDGGNDTLYLTYLGHRQTKKNAKESELSYVVYQLRPSEKFPGRRDLYRGETPRIPEDVSRERELPPMQLFASNIAAMQLDGWLGDDWSKDGWDSTRGDKDNKLPPMVRIVLKGWNDDPAATAVPGAENAEVEEQAPDVYYSTLVYLPFSLDFNSVKTRMGSFRL